MKKILQSDFIQSIADAFQYISYYHPVDYIEALNKAYIKEKSQPAKAAIAQILINSRLCAEGKRPICQDTGIAVVFLKIGMNVQWDANLSIAEMVNTGIRLAYNNPNNKLRASIVSDPIGKRINSQDNTPAVIHYEMTTGEYVDVICAAKGGGSENKSKMIMLNPSDSVVEWVLKTIPTMGSGWCPPGILGIGIGGTPEKAMLLAKESLMAPIDIHNLSEKGAKNKIEELRLEIFHKVNALGIGAQGLGGLTTILDVKILDYPTHAASLPVAMIPNCAATRHIHFQLIGGAGPVNLEPPNMLHWPNIDWRPNNQESLRVNLNTLNQEEISSWKTGQTLLLNGKLITGRDAAHKRIADMISKNEVLPFNFKNRVIYYVGPVDAIKDEVIGPAGPTTASRMDKFTEMMLSEIGIIAMIGKAERSPAVIEMIKKYRSAYLIAVGGAAYLISKTIRQAKILHFEDLGMEAIYEFTVIDMPVIVAIDSHGSSIHDTGPKKWESKNIKWTLS